VLEYQLNGKSINNVLNRTVRQVLEYFQIDKITSKPQAMSEVGLDYLTLGQPLGTLSGGQRQHIKLASELQKQGSSYVLDEPTTGFTHVRYQSPAGDHGPAGGHRKEFADQ
jgi:excinuclease UvrABC ATPase subunit